MTVMAMAFQEWRIAMDNDQVEDDVIDLGSATRETRAMPYGADDSKAGLWLQAGLTLD
jgi:hypothetical protein